MRNPSYRYGTVILAALLWLLGAPASAGTVSHGRPAVHADAEAHGVAASYPDLPFAAQHESRSATLEGVSLPHGRAGAQLAAAPATRRSPLSRGGDSYARALRPVPLQESCLPPPAR